jgi:HSP20 family protein
MSPYVHSQPPYHTPYYGTIQEAPEHYPTPDPLYYSSAAFPEKTYSDNPQTRTLSKGSVVTYNPVRRTRWSPYLDVWEDDTNIYIEVDIPGFDKERIDLNVYGEEDRKCVVIMGEEESKGEAAEREYVHRERHPRGRFKRTVHLPVYAQTDSMKATYENGILRITVPKSKPIHKVKKIEIRDHKGWSAPVIRETIEEGVAPVGDETTSTTTTTAPAYKAATA